MGKILICGHFANNKISYDGQTIKTINVYKELVKKYGSDNVIVIDTYFIKKRPLKFFIDVFKQVKLVDNVIVLPAQRGIKIIIPLFNFLKFNYKFKIHYIVIGSWLPSLIKDKKRLTKNLKKVEYIYLETNGSINKLKKCGFKNLYQMNNFKNLKVSNNKYVLSKEVLKCCIFSRIEHLKGINDAIDVVDELNLKNKRKITLDLYGKVKAEYKQQFYKKIENNEFINYKGVINSEDSVLTLEKYDLLLFPTLYYTEGIPGTIIDAYFAGVPVLSSKWENFDEVIEDGVTGIGYKFGKTDEFKNKMLEILNGKYNLTKMSCNCKKNAKEYLPEESMRILYENLGDLNANK